MDLGTFLCWLCAIPIVSYILMYEINWPAIKARRARANKKNRR
jgi:hypothetical protein